MFTQLLGTATVYDVVAAPKALPAPMQQRKGITTCPTQLHPA
jgi:hypothetical protein